MSHFNLNIELTPNDLLDYTDSRHLAQQARQQSAESLLATKLNDVISHLRHYGIIKLYPIRFHLRQVGEHSFEVHIKGTSDLKPHGYPGQKSNLTDHDKPDNTPLAPQFGLDFKVDKDTTDKQLQDVWDKLDSIQHKWYGDQHSADPAYLKPYGTIPMKPQNASVVVDKHRDKIARFLIQWFHRQARNHLWDISITDSKLPRHHTIGIRRNGWFNYRIKHHIDLRAQTLWTTVENFRRKITTLEMAKQQHQLAIHNDTQNAIEIVRKYQKTLHKDAQFWSHILNQWSNQTGSQPTITANTMDKQVFLL